MYIIFDQIDKNQFQENMNKYFYLLILNYLIFLGKNISFSGTLQLSFAEAAEDIAFSQDGRKLIIPQVNAQTLLVFENNGTNFQHTLSIPLSFEPKYLSYSFSKKNLIVRSTASFSIFDGEQYSLIQTENQQNGRFPTISNDDQFIYIPSTGKVSIYEKNNNVYELSQQLADNQYPYSHFSVSSDNRFFAVGIYATSQVLIYEYAGGMYSLKQIIAKGGGVATVKITKNTMIFITGSSIFEYKEISGVFTEISSSVGISMAFSASVREDCQVLYLGGLTQLAIFEKKEVGFEKTQSIAISSFPKLVLIADQKGYYYISSFWNGSFLVNYICPPECLDCFLPNNCINCIPGYLLINGICTIEPSPSPSLPKLTYCVKNNFFDSEICERYCQRQCQTCNQTRFDCFKCSKLYKKQKGKCQVQSEALKIATRIRYFLNFIRRGGIKFILLAVDDLWLYSFHKQKYDGILKTVLETLQLIEEKQWELIGLEQVKMTLENMISDIEQYNPYSNPRYMEEQRKNNSFFQNTIDFFAFFLPCLFLFTFIFNRLFYLLFNHSVSIIFRPYSFWWILFEFAVQNNIEYFTFLGFRTLTVPFTFSFFSRIVFILTIIMFFLVVLSTFSSYLLYYCWYGKLARYFLVNMYRFPSSYILMIISYGIRPFVRGLIHALFHDSMITQLHLLTGGDILMLLILLGFQYFLDNHKSKKIFISEILYVLSFITLNILILFKYYYFPNQEQKMEAYIQLTLYTMLTCLCFRFLLQLLDNISWKCIIETCCKKRQASISPGANLRKQKQQEMSESTSKTSKSRLQRINRFILQIYRKKYGQARSNKEKQQKMNEY